MNEDQAGTYEDGLKFAAIGSIENIIRPDFEGFIDEEILNRFSDRAFFHGDIINAQLIKTLRLMTEELRQLKLALSVKSHEQV